MGKKSKVESRQEIFDRIAEAADFGNLGLFIGAGLTMAVMNEDSRTALSWKDLLFKCAKKFGIDRDNLNLEGSSLPDIASVICRMYSDIKGIRYSAAVLEMKETISDITAWYPDNETRKKYGNYFNTIEPNWIITTNYDTVIESILTGRGYSLTPSDSLIAPSGFIPVYHLHGIRTNPESIIITQEDYISLFRPNQYRLQKLPLTIKESLTVLLGYNLGDFNVLTAVDWSNNVFNSQPTTQHPTGIIQLNYTDTPNPEPYYFHNSITVLDFDNTEELLSELADYIRDDRDKNKKIQKALYEINESLVNTSEEKTKSFVDDQQFRLNMIDMLKENGGYVVTGFIELFSKAINITWERAQVNNAFYAYNENLVILLDVLENMPIKLIPPALLESLAYNLNRVASYIGRNLGDSYEAASTWDLRKSKLDPIMVKELLNIARNRRFYRLKEMLEDQ
jgi:hypothetical protein